MARALHLLLLAGGLLAATPADAKEAGQARPPRAQVVTFGDAVLDGSAARPGVGIVFSRAGSVFVPMIPVRRDFERELDRSVDGL